MQKSLVAYFSASGTTARAAKRLAKAAGADLYEIAPAKPYTSADLNWNNRRSRSSVEMNNPESRPDLANHDAQVDKYDIVFVGFPIWWYKAPRIINSFFEAYDFSGKTVALFATSGGSGLGTIADDLMRSCPGVTIAGARLLNGHQSTADLRDWVKSLEK